MKMYNFFNDDNKFGLKSMDLFQFAVLNPQIALLSFLKVGQKAVTQPKKLEESQKDLLERLSALQQKFLQDICDKDDKTIDLNRTKREQGVNYYSVDDNPLFSFANQFYDTTSQWMMDTLDKFDNVDPKLMRSARFFLRQ